MAFGDESESDTLLIYALAIFRTERTQDARAVLSRMKQSLGVPDEARLHCRVVFSGQQRRRSAWAGVNPLRIEQAVRDLVAEMRQLGERPEIGVIDRRQVPPLPVAPGHADREWHGKETLALAANVAIMGAVSKYGADHVRFIIDQDKTQIRRGLRRQQADSTRGLFLDVGAGHEPVRIEPVVQDDSLLEIADLYAYVTLRAHARPPGRLFLELFNAMQPHMPTIDLSGHGPWTDAANRPVE